MKKWIILIVVFFSFPISSFCADDVEVTSMKKERNFISDGNKLYRQSRFAEAEAMYNKALMVNPSSEVAKINLALSLIRQAGATDLNDENNPVAKATDVLRQLSETAKSKEVKEGTHYNLGNLAFNSQQYDEAIKQYKSALRINPDNDNTRQNLRLAQLKKQQQDQNQDKNKDQDKNQDQNQDQDKNQNQDQNKDQNQDKQDQQNEDKNKDQQQQNQDQQNKDQNKQKQQQSGGISEANAEKILKAMENEENATRRRVEAKNKKVANARSKNVQNPW